MTMHRSRSRILAVLAGAALGLPCVAQDSPSRTPSQPPRTTTQPPRATDPMDRSADSRPAVLIAAKSIIGTNAVSSSGDKLADVNDLLIATKPGRVKYMVLSRGGVAGLGDTLYAVPFTAFDYDEVEEHFILPISEDQIKSAPKLEGTDWKQLAQEDRCKQLNAYYTVQEDEDRLYGKYDDRDWGRRRDDAALQRWPILRASDVRGQTLMSDEGSELGSIKDIVIDRNSGRVAFAVVSFGGTLGLGDSLVAVPWDLFDVNTEGKVFATKMDKEQIKAAPRLESGDWDELEDGVYIRNQYKHFGRDGEWLTTASARDAEGDRHVRRDATTGGPSGVHGKDAPYSDYDQHFAKGRKGDLIGVVSNVSTTSGNGMPQVVLISVNADDKRNVPVHLAPESYLKAHGIALKPGDKVTLHGRWCDVDGKECFMVATITPASGQAVTIRQPDGTRDWR